MSLVLSICVLLISVMQLVIGTEFLNTISLFLSSVRLAVTNCVSVLPAGGLVSPLIAIFPLTSIYESI